MSRPWSEATWRREVRAEIVRQLKARDWRLTRKRMAEVPRPMTTADTTQSPQDASQPLSRAVPDGVACPDCSQVFPDRPSYLAHDIEAHLPTRVAALKPDPPRQKGWTA